MPFQDGKYVFIGKVGEGEVFSIEEGQEATRLCVLGLLSHLRVACHGDLGRVKQCVKLGVFVNCAPSFTQHPLVANGGSDLLVDLFGVEVGSHARSAIGVQSLPRGVAVEVDGVFEIDLEQHVVLNGSWYSTGNGVGGN